MYISKVGYWLGLSYILFKDYLQDNKRKQTTIQKIINDDFQHPLGSHQLCPL